MSVSQALNARSRALLMQKLDRTGMAAVVPPPAPLAGIPLMGAPVPHAQKPIGLPSQYLLLENMFDPAKEVRAWSGSWKHPYQHQIGSLWGTFCVCTELTIRSAYEAPVFCDI